MNRAQPIVLEIIICCASSGYILYLYALFFFILTLDIPPDHLDRGSSRADQAKTSAPEIFVPQFGLYLGILFFYQPAACTFICIQKLRQLCVRMSGEQYMNIVIIMIPFAKRDVIFRLNVLEYCFQSVWLFVSSFTQRLLFVILTADYITYCAYCQLTISYGLSFFCAIHHPTC